MRIFCIGIRGTGLADDARAAVKEIDDGRRRDDRKRGGARRATRGAKRLRKWRERTSWGGAELPRVTGVRHWSTPDYTRVAIDIEREVKFNSSRIANPDRIFFDLRETKLASTLVGKTFDVDDGFLKKIRVAEFQPGRTRIVLEVDDLSSYDAFLLPDPYRLIIDIHGKQSRAAMLAKAHRDEAGDRRLRRTADDEADDAERPASKRTKGNRKKSMPSS